MTIVLDSKNNTIGIVINSANNTIAIVIKPI